MSPRIPNDARRSTHPGFPECRGIVFDLDGTLIDSYEAIAESLNAAMQEMDHAPLPVGTVRGMVGRGLETLIEAALRDAGDPDPEGRVAEGVRRFRARYDRICVARTSLLPGVEATLAELSRRGYRMSVATNKPSYFARRLLEALGVARHLRAVLGPDLVASPKPDPEMVHAAIAAMDLKAAEAVYVGDMEIDVQTARAAGLAVIVMPTGSSGIEALEASDADVVVADFTALLDLLPGA